MRIAVLVALTASGVSWAGTELRPAAGPLEQMKSLAGEWQADLPGYGQILNSIRLVSKGTAVEETIGTISTRNGPRPRTAWIPCLT